MKNKSLILWGIVIGVFVLAVILISSNSASAYQNLKSFDGEMKFYKSSTCGCCEVYSSYFKSKGSSKIEIVNGIDNTKIMEKYGIPKSLESCHTTIIGDYFIEGHVPLEAIEKLLLEKPDIAGIGIPGMPNGSPGMPGSKTGDFVIYGINNDGSSFEFMRI